MKNKHKYTNALINETSPYLLQHAHNPVDWHPWNEETLAKAKKEDKMLIISIGYAACHWCHVMEHESFEDSLIAAQMNTNFICIKVDREERPDIDDVYMTACQLASGRGCGWPLNAFALPDGRPVWAGTYFPKDQWSNILKQFSELQKNDSPKLEEAADKITSGINSSSSITVNTIEATYTSEELEQITNRFVENIDFVDGGKQGAPKFPMPNNYEFLLQYHYMTGDEKVLNAAKLTLDKMANGGIYDQLGGGFARYSVDSRWLAPHFEKMLYDNGQLISLYSHAYQLLKDPLYKNVIEQTIEFIERELMDSSNGFYSSLDADSEGEEGKFYVWQSNEIDSIIQDTRKAKIYKDYYFVKEEGNWEHTNILFKVNANIAKRYNISNEELENIINEGNKLLFDFRQNRTRPGTDDKILTSWNGLILKGYIDAYKALGTESYKKTALKNAEFLLNNSIQSDGSLNRNYKNGISNINAFLDDYATVIDAFIGIYEITFDQSWLDKARELTEYVNQHFFDDNSRMFFYTSDEDAALIARKMELTDNVIPASNSIMARNLFKLGTLYSDNKLLSQSKQMLNNMLDDLTASSTPSFYSNWCQLYASMITPPYEIAILGKESSLKAKEMQSQYLPNALFLGGTTEGSLDLLKDKLQDGETMIYVCQNKVCKLPTTETKKALTLMD